MVYGKLLLRAVQPRGRHTRLPDKRTRVEINARAEIHGRTMRWRFHWPGVSWYMPIARLLSSSESSLCLPVRLYKTPDSWRGEAAHSLAAQNAESCSIVLVVVTFRFPYRTIQRRWSHGSRALTPKATRHRKNTTHTYHMERINKKTTLI